MALKVEERSDLRSTWNKALETEPLFILRPTDRTAPDVILAWISKAAAAGSMPDKLRGAAELFFKVVEWQRQNPHLVKSPD